MKFNDYLQEAYNAYITDNTSVSSFITEMEMNFKMKKLVAFFNDFDKTNKTDFSKRLKVIQQDIEKFGDDFMDAY